MAQGLPWEPSGPAEQKNERKDKMSEEKVIVVAKQKTAAPIILGIIAFILAIPGMLCSTFCAALVSEASHGEHGSGIVWLMVVPTLVNFVLCFFCKSGKSKTTGLVMVLLSVLMLLIAVLLISLFGIAVAILFMVAGGLSISNAKRPN